MLLPPVRRFAPACLLGLLLLATTACGGDQDPSPAACGALDANPELRDRQLASCLTADPPLATWSSSGERSPVALYVDRSGSMRGFLDPDYPARTDYRRVIDRLIVALQPEEAFGFGSSLDRIDTSLGTLGDRAFYSQNNTEMEDALARIAEDTSASRTHVIVGDGRRTDPDLANEQYVRMRQLAQRWIEQGGSFLVAASRAPFERVPGDPAGCGAASDSVIDSCPLYAFAYVAPGAVTQIVGTFAAADVFDHLFVWPLPAAVPTRVSPLERRPDLSVEPGWESAPDGNPIARVRGQEFTNDPLRARLEFNGSDATAAAARVALEGQELRDQVYVRRLDPSADSPEWAAVTAAGSLVRAVPGESGTVEFVSRGPSEQPFLYRVERYPTGQATWLAEFDAESSGDAVRTYGLGRLFELFRARAQAGDIEPVQRAYIVVN